jgi:hypothetical protein
VTYVAFAIRNLSVLAYAQGFTLWHYKAGNAPLADLDRPGFFDNAGDMMAPGDMIMISASDGGRIVFVPSTGGVRTDEPLGVVTAPLA